MSSAPTPAEFSALCAKYDQRAAGGDQVVRPKKVKQCEELTNKEFVAVLATRFPKVAAAVHYHYIEGKHIGQILGLETFWAPFPGDALDCKTFMRGMIGKAVEIPT